MTPPFIEHDLFRKTGFHFFRIMQS